MTSIFKLQRIPLIPGLLSATVVLLLSCNSKQNEIEEIAIKIHKNQCVIEKISQYVDQSWTESIKELGNYLPERLPDQERQNILNLKNADLIRMFESYKEFDPKGHAIVDSMERLDITWADSLRNLSMENQKLELRMDSLFSVIDEPEDVEKLSQVVKEIKSTPCEEIHID